ncbi:hypothetical protein MIZ03_3500 [Rhodoferax lithotrophicus]|uniref:Uncharacterized protein n=1 Tax=Rhodoferax lithotrophicus TaxID=2798804 RepID=A0ABM7MQI3_9BURK|nr:hypothetical protein MIZ03_3500 [Rhodoferax sp. MIZ03]
MYIELPKKNVFGTSLYGKRIARPCCAQDIHRLIQAAPTQSGAYLLDMAASNPHLKAVRLSRNFGKEAALTADQPF